MGQNDVPIVQFHLEHGVWQSFEYPAFDLDAFLFCHSYHLLPRILPRRMKPFVMLVLQVGLELPEGLQGHADGDEHRWSRRCRRSC